MLCGYAASMNPALFHFRLRARRWQVLHTLLLALAILLLSRAFGADTLDWSKETSVVADGATNFTINNVSGYSGNVAFAITGNTGTFFSGNYSHYPQVANPDTYPAVQSGSGGKWTGSDVTGGSTDDSLQLFGKFSSNTESITLNMFFSTPVQAVSFSLFDLDIGTYNSSGGNAGTYSFQDQVTILGSSNGGTTWFNPTDITGNTSNVAITGNTVTGITSGVNNSSSNNAQIVFANPVNDIKIVYLPGPLSQSQPDQQAIGLDNVHFTPVPEPGTLLAGALPALWLAARALHRAGAPTPG
jgi:hypothetical protein